MSSTRHERETLVSIAHKISAKGLTHGRTGNVSVRVGQHMLVTPTGVSLGDVSADYLSVIDLAGRHLDGPRPTKEAFLHAAVLRARPTETAVIHTHSTYSAAVSCLEPTDEGSIIPCLTAYFAMRVGRVPLLPYHEPGDASLEGLAEETARTHRALMLSHHGPVVAGVDLESALDSLEELEETAKLSLLLRNADPRVLSRQQALALEGV